MSHHSYAIEPAAEARNAAGEYRDAVQAAQDAGHAGLRTGDFTDYPAAFAALQDAAHTAITARRTSDHASSTPRLRVVR